MLARVTAGSLVLGNGFISPFSALLSGFWDLLDLVVTGLAFWLYTADYSTESRSFTQASFSRRDSDGNRTFLITSLMVS